MSVMFFTFMLTQSFGQIIQPKDTLELSTKIKNEITTQGVSNSVTRKGLFGTYLKNAVYGVEVPFGLTNVFGLNEYVGDKIEYTEYWNPKTNLDDYNFNYQPIKLDVSPKILFSGAVYVKFNKYTFGVKGASFNFGSSLAGKITTPPIATTKDGVQVFYYNWLRYWNRNMFPLTNDLEPSGLSPVWYSAENSFKLWSVDVFISQELYNDAKNAFSFSYGVKFMKPDYKLQLNMRQLAHIDNYSGYWNFENWVSIESTHQSKFSLFAGPSFGVSYTRYIGNFEVTPTLSQSFSFGYEKDDGNFYDVDDIHFNNSKTGVVIPLYYDGYANFNSEAFVMIPSTEASLKLAYAINDYMAIGTSANYYVYWNMPLGPRWDNPWAQGPWETKVENIGVSATAVYLKLNF